MKPWIRHVKPKGEGFHRFIGLVGAGILGFAVGRLNIVMPCISGVIVGHTYHLKAGVFRFSFARHVTDGVTGLKAS